MPYPSQVTPETIIGKARTMLERDGIEAVSLAKLAAELGIKAPSLYRYFNSKTDLLRAINTETNTRLIGALHDAAQMDNPAERLLAIAAAYREFAHANPTAYALAFTATMPDIQPDAAELERMVIPIQAMMAEVSGQPESLTALRGLLALIHGFVSLELNGQFRRGGDLSEAFSRSVQAYIAGWQR